MTAIRSAPPARRSGRLRVAATGACALLLLLLPHPAAAAAPPPARGERGMVVTPEAHASTIGLEVLRSGGNAVDAAVAVAFALDVTYPLAAPLGGGGFLLRRSPEGSYDALDFRETAPAALRAAAFLDADGRPITNRSLTSGLAVGVPGGVAGLAEAHARWGTRPWAELVAPAAGLAAEGIVVYPWLAHALKTEESKLLASPALRRLFAPQGALLRVGEPLVQPQLAVTLRTIAESGRAGFYEGPVAAAIVAAVREAGGVMTAADLTAYRPLRRDPLVGSYRGHRIATFPPPSAGGVALLQVLGMLERFDLRAEGPGSSAAVHLIAEAQRRAFADRAAWLGDPEFVDVPLTRLVAADYLAERAASIAADRATPSGAVAAGRALEPVAAGETLHVSIADAEGGVVAMTLTLNAWFGAGILAEGIGVLLNNEIDDFALAPGVPNLYGLTGGEANALRPGKRPLSSMTPTIVEHPTPGRRPALVLGSPGGSTILSAVVQVLLHVVDFETPLAEAVSAPRFHHQWLPDRLLHEARAFPADVRRNLLARGHALEQAARPLGNVNAIATVSADGAWLGVADPRRSGSAAGW